MHIYNAIILNPVAIGPPAPRACTILAPDWPTLAEARAGLALQFGPARVATVAARAEPQPDPAPAAAPPPAAAPTRHRWAKVREHVRQCTRCGIERRTHQDPRGRYFHVFAAPGKAGRRSDRTPPCEVDE
jgi:hypothetical protein